MVALKFSDQKSFPKYQLDQEKCAPHTWRCADTELAGLGQEKCSTSPKAGTTSIWSLICDVLLIVCSGLVILLVISVARETTIWIYFNQGSETSEILVSREFSRIFFHFHFSFSISSRFNFTFTSRKRVKGFYFSLFTSRKK